MATFSNYKKNRIAEINAMQKQMKKSEHEVNEINAKYEKTTEKADAFNYITGRPLGEEEEETIEEVEE